MSKKLITSFVALSFLLSLVVPALKVQATKIDIGDLVVATTACKGFPKDAVYLVSGTNLIVFPYLSVYLSHGYPADFSVVKTVQCSDLDAYTVAGYAKFRNGSAFRADKQTIYGNFEARSVFLMEDGKMRPIKSCSVYNSLFGVTDCKGLTYWVPDAFIDTVKYEIGSLIEDLTVYPKGVFVQLPDGSYGITGENNTVRKFSTLSAVAANRYNTARAAKPTKTFTEGTPITGAESALLAVGVHPITPPTAGLTVRLAFDTPASARVPSNATGVVFTKVNFTADNTADVTINSITVKRTGLGSSSELSKVYLYDGAKRLTTGRTINPSTNEAIFVNLNYTVPKGTTKTLSLVADIANSSSGDHALGITSVVSTATSVSGLPVTGNVMSTSTISVGKFDVESNGASYTRKVGEVNEEIANFTIYVDRTEDAQFKAITLYNSGRDILNNLKLYRGSDLIASAEKFGSNFVFVLDTPYNINKGESATFTVKGDVSGRRGDTATLYVRYKADVVVTGKTYGYNLGVDNTLGGSNNSYIEEVDSTPLSNTTTVEAGQITFALTGPSAANVTKGTNNVVLATFSLTSQSTVEVSKFTVNINGTNLTPDDVSNLDLVIDNNIVGTLSSVTIGNNVFTDLFTLPGGKTVQGKIMIDVTNDAERDDTIKAIIKDLTSTNNFVAKTLDGDTVTDIVPSGDVAGQTMTVTEASLTIDVSSTPSRQTYIKGTQDAAMVGFTFTAGQAADVKVTSIKLTAYRDANRNGFNDNEGDKNQNSGARDVLTAIGIYDGENLLTAKKTLVVGSSDITVTFSGLNWIIPKNTSKTLVVKADLATTLPDNDADDVAITIAKANDVVAEYGPGINLTPVLVPDKSNNDPTIYQTITLAGTLTTALAADNPASAIIPVGNVVGGSSAETEVLRVRFGANNEDIRLEKLTLHRNYPNKNNIVEVNVYDGTTKVATGSFAVGSATKVVDLNPYVVVPKGGYKTLSVRVKYASTASGATSGDTSTIGVSVASGQAVGVVSGDNTITGTQRNGNQMTLYRTTLTVNSVASASTIRAGDGEEVMKFKVTANEKDDVTLKTLTLTVAKSSGQTITGTGNLEIKRSGDNAVVYRLRNKAPTNTSADITRNGNTLTFAANHGLQVGDVFQYCISVSQGACDDWSDNVVVHQVNSATKVVAKKLNGADLNQNPATGSNTDSKQGTAAFLDLSSLVVPSQPNNVVSAGAEKTFTVYGDTTGMSADKIIQLKIISGSDLIWDDGNIDVSSTLIKEFPVIGTAAKIM